MHDISRDSLTRRHRVTIKDSELLEPLLSLANPVEPPRPGYGRQLAAEAILFISVEVLGTHSEIWVLTHPRVGELPKEVLDGRRWQRRARAGR